MNKIILFDLDNTLAPSKSLISKEMVNELNKLMEIFYIGIISGASYKQFEKQVLSMFDKTNLEKLYLFPTCGASFYKFDQEWKNIYTEQLSNSDKEKIFNAFQKCFEQIDTNYQIYGNLIEDRQTQITFSGLGQEAPLELKEKWDPDFAKRKNIVNILQKYIPEFSIRMGGSTSIDITYPNIDKASAIGKIKQYLNYNLEDCLFIGDSFLENGNDYPIKKIGMDYIETSGPGETIKIIQKIKQSCLQKSSQILQVI